MQARVSAPHADARPRLSSAQKSLQNSDAELVETAREMFRRLGCTALANSVQVRWNPRMRSTAGTASYAKSVVTLNPKLREFGGDEILRTLKHELAHLLAKHRAGRRRIAPHGDEWKRACRDLGLDDEKRCHNLPLPRRQVARRHIYRCPACESEIRRARPFRRRVACLACCRAHNRGRYDEKFRLKKSAP
jgi:SprT protein